MSVDFLSKIRSKSVEIQKVQSTQEGKEYSISTIAGITQSNGRINAGFTW